jgi:nicotinate-nucleotide adenylyltransferase
LLYSFYLLPLLYSNVCIFIKIAYKTSNIMKVGIFGGSFNPIHLGHLVIANSALNLSNLDEIWFVVSPHNPDKNKNSLLDANKRLELTRIATHDNPKFKVCSIEFELEQPSYTNNTMDALNERYPDIEFSLLMGEDNIKHLHTWEGYEDLIKHDIYVYPRETNMENYDGIGIKINTPRIEVSATDIRNLIKDDKSIQYLVHHSTYALIEKFYSELNSSD